MFSLKSLPTLKFWGSKRVDARGQGQVYGCEESRGTSEEPANGGPVQFTVEFEGFQPLKAASRGVRIFKRATAESDELEQLRKEKRRLEDSLLGAVEGISKA